MTPLLIWYPVVLLLLTYLDNVLLVLTLIEDVLLTFLGGNQMLIMNYVCLETGEGVTKFGERVLH